MTLTSLRDLVDSLGQVDGPKQIVLITGGPVFSRSEWSYVTDIGRVSGVSRVTIHALQVHQPATDATAAMRAAPESPDQVNTAATALASETGGLWITPAVPTIGFARLARELSASYLLGIESESTDRDGKSHGIDVKVRAVAAGGLVRARRSFRIDAKAGAAAIVPEALSRRRQSRSRSLLTLGPLTRREP